MGWLTPFSVAVALGVVAAAFVGLFDRPTGPWELIQPEHTFAVKGYTGDFSQITAAFEEVASLVAKADAFHTNAAKGAVRKSVGIYFDNPVLVETDKLRWYVGIEVPKDNEVADRLVAADNKVRVITLPQSRVVQAAFPYRSVLSFMLGAKAAYPLMAEYIAAREKADGLSSDSPAVEMYDLAFVDDKGTERFIGAQYMWYQENTEVLKWQE